MTACPACGTANPEGFRFCGACAAPLGPAAPSREVRKTVTALFCDLVGSTALGETHDPEVLRPILHAYFEAMRAAVEHHGGRVEKYIGDAVVAVFGLPIAHEDDALRSVRAAVEMTESLAALNDGAAIALAVRIGVTTGEVLVQASADPILGDTMNTAARLQACAEPGTILIGEPTWRLVRDAVVAEPVERLELKGKQEAVAAHRVVAVASLSPMHARRLDAPMVGRAREATLLAGVFERVVVDRSCQLLTVLGPAGSGKSRLVEEFIDGRTTDTRAPEILRGHCLAYGDGITYYPVTEALRQALGLAAFAEATAVRAAIAEAVAGEEHAGALEATLRSLFAVGPGRGAEETAWAIRTVLEGRARRRPLILVLDDIHWAEQTFLDLVEHIVDRGRDVPILVLCMARPDLLDVRPGWGTGRTNATTIALAPLDGADTDALIDGLLGAATLPDPVRARISLVAEGNPLFVEETLRMLVDDGFVVRTDTGWVAARDLSDVRVPPTVAALLSARLDRLSAAERPAIEAASVAGTVFHRGAVVALLPEAAATSLGIELRSLVRKELIAPERSMLRGEDAFRFRHLLIRDTAYDAIPKRIRARQHEAFADWLATVAGERIAEQEEIVGYHLERSLRYGEELGLGDGAGLRLRAATALGNAGARALDRGDIRGAIDLLGRAADLEPGGTVELEALSSLASALLWAGRTDATSVIGRLAQAAAGQADAVFSARAGILSFAVATMADPGSVRRDDAVALVEEALRTYRAAGATRFEPEALLWLSNIAWSDGDSAGCLRHAREALDLATALADRSSASWAVNNILSSLELGPTPLTDARTQTESFRARFSGDRWMESRTLIEAAYIEAILGCPDEARRHLAASQVIVDALGLAPGAAAAAVPLAYVAWHAGDLETAASLFADTIALWEAAGDRLNRGWIGPDLARIQLELGREQDAAATIGLLAGDRPRPDRASFRSLSSLLAARRGDIDAALRLADEAIAIAAGTDQLMLQGDIAFDRAQVLVLAGRDDEARRAALDALLIHRRKGCVIGIARAEALLATLTEPSGPVPASAGTRGSDATAAP